MFIDVISAHDGTSGPAGAPAVVVQHDGSRKLGRGETRMTLDEWNAGAAVRATEWDAWMAQQPPAPPPVPAAITARQLRLWLVRNSYTLAQVEALIDALPEPQRTEARIEWQDATQFERGHPLLRQLAGALLGLDGAALDQALDAAFIDAASI